MRKARDRCDFPLAAIVPRICDTNFLGTEQYLPPAVCQIGDPTPGRRFVGVLMGLRSGQAVLGGCCHLPGSGRTCSSGCPPPSSNAASGAARSWPPPQTMNRPPHQPIHSPAPLPRRRADGAAPRPYKEPPDHLGQLARNTIEVTLPQTGRRAAAWESGDQTGFPGLTCARLPRFLRPARCAAHVNTAGARLFTTLPANRPCGRQYPGPNLKLPRQTTIPNRKLQPKGATRTDPASVQFTQNRAVPALR
jgi:hypothetical protein